MTITCELGIDEAGRGPILGPMVIAGVVVPDNKANLLKEWEIADSKYFGSTAKGKQRRAEFTDKIMGEFDHHVINLSSQQVDQYVTNKSLNILEQETARILIKSLPANRVVLDGHNLFAPLTNDTIKALNKADQTHLSVAAASILAKNERDRQFKLLCEPFESEFGEIKGGGYANQATLKFVRWYLDRYGRLPDFYRTSYQWKLLSKEEPAG